MATVLFAPNLSPALSPAAREWILSVCRALQGLGHAVTLFPSTPVPTACRSEFTALDVAVLPPAAEDAARLSPRRHAQRIVTLDREFGADWTLVQGADLVTAVARGGALASRLWALPVDAPYRTEPLDPGLLSRLAEISAGTHRFLVPAEEQRAVLEATHPGTTSRVRLLPALPPRDPATPPAQGLDLEVDLDFFSTGSVPDLSAYVARTREMRAVPKVFVTGAADAPCAEDPRWNALAGRQLRRGVDPSPATYGLVPTTADPVGRAAAVLHHLGRGTQPVAIAEPHAHAGDHPALRILPSSLDLLEPAPAPDSILDRPAPPVVDAPSAGWFPRVRARTPLGASPSRPLRVVVAGSDFKFAGDLLRGLAEHPDVDLRIDQFAHHNHPQPDISREYLEWADVVIAEFAVRNAIWYSQNLRPGQHLIVRLHGFELLSDFIDDLRVDRCSAILVPSDAYRDQALGMKGWPASVVRAMPNSVDRDDLFRGKLPDARFHLGLAGYVPILKRPDRALDLLAALRRQDDRYVLHLRGHSPFDYRYEWAKAAHQDAYRVFFDRIGSDPLLRDGVAFEPFGPDMGNWLRRIGWILSPSTRETFHLAGVEGAASGAVPLVWDRRGAAEVFGRQWTFPTTEAIADFVLRANRTDQGHQALSAQAQRMTDRYETDTVVDRWVGLLDELTAPAPGGAARPLNGQATHTSPEGDLLAGVDDALRAGSYAGALQLLDADPAAVRTGGARLRDADLWVRGVAALDARRFRLLLPGQPARRPASGLPLTVRRAGASSISMALTGLERWTVDIVPHTYTDPRDAAVTQSGDDVQPDRGMAVSDVPDPARADRWIEVHAGRIAAEALRTGRGRLLARGPWWVGLPAVLAGDRLGLPVTWMVTDPADVARAERGLAEPDSDEPLDHVVLRAFAGTSEVVDETGLLAGSPLAGGLTLAATPCTDLSTGGPVARPWAGLDYPGRTAAVERRPDELTVVLAGDEAAGRAWEESGAHVRRLTPEDLYDPVDPRTDLLVLDLATATDSAWSAVLSRSSPEGPVAIQRLLTAGRTVGARVVVLGHRAEGDLEPLLPLLRRADLATVRTPGQASAVVSDSRSAVERVLPVADDAPRPAGLLRWAGVPSPLGPLPVPADAAPDSPVEDAPSPVVSRPGHKGHDEASPWVDGITVILATHRGADRIQGMLDSLAAQSLPRHLLQLIVVENGGTPQSKALVQRFTTDTGIEALYRFEPTPGVGRARNIGLAQATREYVTFVDDDDLLDRNFLLSLWLAAGPRDVVLGTLHDLLPDGARVLDTPTARRLTALGGRRRPLGRHGMALGMNACKLIPTTLAQDCKYPEDLTSGEDVVYMAQLLGRGLHWAPASPAAEAAYVRLVRHDSVSRRDLTFGFAVQERLAVMRHLSATANRLSDPHDRGTITRLLRYQATFVARYRAEHHGDRDRVDAAIRDAGLEEVPELR